MADISPVPGQLKLNMKGVELVKTQINTPIPNFTAKEFQFTLNLETRLDPAQQLVIVITSADVKSDNKPEILASVASACIFRIDNFEEVFKKKPDGIFDMPDDQGLFTLISISISTLRGVMFEQFRGTYLHTAFLPIMDPKQFKVAEK